MARDCGRCPRGERPRFGVPDGHWKTTTVIAGITASDIIVPWVLDGATTHDVFKVYVENVLIPELKPGAMVVMDNLSSHKGPKGRQMIEAAVTCP